MSGGTNNFTPTSRNWQVGHDYGAYAPDNSDWNSRQAPLSRFGSASFRADPDANRGAHHPRQPFEQRRITGPFSVAGFPVGIPILGNLMARENRPSHIPVSQVSSPGFMNGLNIHPTQEDNSRDEQNAVLKKLKKTIYHPSMKKLTRGLSLYYRDQAVNVYHEMEKQREKDGMRCSICLEDFENKETVMLTPCNHMFHEHCIVPWVRSHVQCPLCRFSFGEQSRENESNNTINTANVAGNDLFEADIMSVMRAMEEDFIWNNAAH